MKYTAVILSLLLFMVFVVSGASASILDNIKKNQSGVRSVKSSFKQEKRTELFARTIKTEGTFYFKASVGVRWEYGDEMLVIYDGKSLYLYYIELKEAEKVDGVSGFVGPLSFDIAELVRDYEVEAAEKEGKYVLHLLPLKQVPFESMDMVFDKDGAFPEKVIIMEQTGDRTEIRFSDTEINVELKDELFRFSAPEGVKVRERVLR